jgi:myo-inositol-1(or 4)-monophosphatase
MGSAALDACMVADGTVDVYYEKHIKEHDWAAALLIAEEAGQLVRRPDFVGDFGSVNL